jgi:hypothetical protein
VHKAREVIMDYSVQGVTDPRIEQIAADVAVRMDKTLARIGFPEDIRARWFEESPESPLMLARTVAEGFAAPPAALIGAILLLRPSIMNGEVDPQWVEARYGRDIYQRLQPLVSFNAVCMSLEDQAARLRTAPADARVVEQAVMLQLLRCGLEALEENPVAKTDYGMRQAGADKVIEACRGANPVLDAEIDRCLSGIRKYYPALPPSAAAANRPAPP